MTDLLDVYIRVQIVFLPLFAWWALGNALGAKHPSVPRPPRMGYRPPIRRGPSARPLGKWGIARG